MKPKTIITTGLIATITLVAFLFLTSCVITHRIEYSGTITVQQTAPDISRWIENEGTINVTPGSQIRLWGPDRYSLDMNDDFWQDQNGGWIMDDDFFVPADKLTTNPWEGHTLQLLEGDGVYIIDGGDDGFIIMSDTTTMEDNPWDLSIPGTGPSDLKACKHERRTTFIYGESKTCKCFDCGFEWLGECPDKI